jgi:hypothetical protein
MSLHFCNKIAPRKKVKITEHIIGIDLNRLLYY